MGQRNPWDRHQTTCDGQRNPPSLHQSTCDGQRNPWDRHQTTASAGATPASSSASASRKTKDTGWKHKLGWLLAYHKAKDWAKLSQLAQAFWQDRAEQLQSATPPPAFQGPADSPTWFSKATWFMTAIHEGKPPSPMDAKLHPLSVM